MTINDVAKIAGVSRATVSRFLNNSGYVGPEARREIQKAIDESGFVLNQEAKALRSGRSNLIGMILPSFGIDYLNEIEEIIQNRFEEEGYNLLITKNASGCHNLPQAFAMMGGRNVDGLFVMHGINGDDIAYEIGRFKRPVVSIGAFPVSPYCVIHSDYDAFKTMAEYAISKNRTRIGLISRYKTDETWYAQTSAVIETLQHYKIPVNPEWFIRMEDAGSKEEHGYKLTQQLLRQPSVPDVILCDTDKGAVGVWRCLQEHGLNTPGDIGIISFGNTDVAKYFTPSFTSLDIGGIEIARIAVELMLDLLRNKEIEQKENYVKPHIVARNSI